MPILNPSFQDAEALPGEAADWTIRSNVSGQAIAGFGRDPELAWEGFERWHEWRDDFDAIAVVLAFFGHPAVGYEAFTSGWVDGYLRNLGAAQIVAGSFGTGRSETWEQAWSNAPFLWAWADVTSAAAAFSDTEAEAFERSWRSNENYARTWQTVASATASFGAENAERFESDWTPANTL